MQMTDIPLQKRQWKLQEILSLINKNYFLIVRIMPIRGIGKLV